MKRFAVSAGLLFNGLREPPKKDVCILVEDGVIARVSPKGEMEDGVHVVDYSGCVVMPGLINAHIHVDMPPVADPHKALIDSNAAERAFMCRNHLEQHLASGVTYVRSLGSRDNLDLEVKSAMEKGYFTGPGMVCSGPNLCMTGGHGWSFGMECDGVDECRKGAREVLKRGADVVKFMATGGVMTPGIEPGSQQFTYEEMVVIVEEAHKAGKKAATHAQGAAGILDAVRAGVDSVEHGIFLTDQIIEMMLKQGTYLVPTLVAPFNIVKNEDNPEVPDYAIRKSKQVMEAHRESFRKAYKAGVKIAMGTDAGTIFNLHSESWLEWILMRDLGVEPEDILVYATSAAADLLGISHRYGTLEPGKMADFIVLKDNPLVHGETLGEIEACYKHGVPFVSGKKD